MIIYWLGVTLTVKLETYSDFIKYDDRLFDIT